LRGLLWRPRQLPFRSDSQRRVALAHRHAVDGKAAHPRAPEGRSRKIDLAHLCDPDGLIACAPHCPARGPDPVVQPSGLAAEHCFKAS
jgi:hypothetical protein